MPTDGNRAAYQRREKSLWDQVSTWTPHWKDITQYIMPRRGRYLGNNLADHNRGSKKNDSIVDPHGTRACITASAGMKSLANKSTRWYTLGTPDPELGEWGPVKHWLHMAETLTYDIFAMSNFYDALTTIFEEMVAFGTAALHIEEDPQSVIRCYPFTVGSYVIALDGSLRPNSLYRKAIFTSGQLVGKFGKENVASGALSEWRDDHTENTREITHLIEPNDDRIPGRSDNKNMPWRSIYFDKQDDPHRVLRSSGFHEFPVCCPRWWVTGNDVYGASPGMMGLPDIRQLQWDARRKGKYLELLVNPPMVGPSELLTKRISTIPGDVTLLDQMGPNTSFKPAWDVAPNVSPQLENIQSLHDSIDQTFFVDVFKMIASKTHPQMTATQVLELAGEKMILLGPVVERSEGELLDKAIRRTLGIAMLADLLPPPPDELAMAGYNVRYISPLSLARLSSGATALEEVAAFTAGLGEAFPAALDKFDSRQAVDEYARFKAIPPSVIRTDDDLEEIDAQKQKELQQQQFMENAERMAAGAKTMSETQVGGQNMLEAAASGGVAQ